MKRALLCLSILFALTGCSRLPPLTPDVLMQAEQRWAMHKPTSYHLVVEMSGDRVETGRFEVDVRGGHAVGLRRNGLVILPNPDQDYSMEGLFRMLTQELGLAEKPAMLGAPAGYTVYTLAKFDDTSGRLIRYRRIVGGTSNSIDVNVLEYKEE